MGGWMRVLGQLLAVLVLCAPGACTSPGVILDPARSTRAWPPPPEKARFAHLGDIRSVEDLKPGRGVGESIGAALFGKAETIALVSPMGVWRDAGSRLFVADSNAQVLQVFDLDARTQRQWRPRAPEKFVRPIAVTGDAVGRVLVADAAGGVVHVFASDGTYIGAIGRGILRHPCGVAVQPGTGNVCIADVETHQIVVLSPSGGEVTRVGTRGSGPGQFNYPTFIAFDDAGRLFVSDSLNFRVQVFAAGFAFERVIGSKGDMPGYFAQPKGLAISREGYLLVVDAHFEALQVFDTQGALLMAFGNEGSGPGEFWLPASVCADKEGRVWITDTYNRRVQAFQYLGGEQ